MCVHMALREKCVPVCVCFKGVCAIRVCVITVKYKALYDSTFVHSKVCVAVHTLGKVCLP